MEITDPQVILLIKIILAIIVGTLAAIVYSLRVLVIMEKRVARMEEHIEVPAAARN